MSTLSLPLRDVEEMLSPAVVKVVADARGDALYFSRSPIPHVRQARPEPRAAAAARRWRAAWPANTSGSTSTGGALLRFASLPPCPLEEAEGLEQLRALHHGMRIRVVERGGRAGPRWTRRRTSSACAR